MTNILISIAAKIAEYPVHPILRQFDYLFDFTRNLKNLSGQAEKLKILQRQVNEQVQRAKTRGDLIEDDVRRWLASVDDIIQQVAKIEDQSKIRRSCFGGLCPNCIYRYRVSRKSTKKVVSIVELRQKGNFNRVSYAAPLPGIEYSSSRNFITFDSRKETTDRIVEALGEDECNVVVLHGPRGIGKSDLVKYVGKTAKEKGMFDEVVIAGVPNYETPDSYLSIQGQLADQLGLTLEEESGFGRARRLCMRLKNEKILIILDGVKKRPDWEAIGIPCALDHRGCKIMITTENEKMCRAMGDGVKKVEIQALSDEDSWRLFRSATGEIVENPAYKVVAEEIVGKCKGLPSIIVTVGKKLRNKGIEEWKDLNNISGTNTANLDELLDYFA